MHHIELSSKALNVSVNIGDNHLASDQQAASQKLGPPAQFTRQAHVGRHQERANKDSHPTEPVRGAVAITPGHSTTATNLGSARMSMFEAEKAPENICAMRRGLPSKQAAAGVIVRPSNTSAEFRVGKGLTLDSK